MAASDEINESKIACIIGAGAAGLCALKHCLQKGLSAVCFELGTELGGTWVYNDNVANVEYDEDVQSSVYEGLLTNLPKEVMGFPDFPFKDDIEESFISAEQVLNYFQFYAQHFKLNDHIKFKHEVIRVRPRSHGNRDKRYWEVCVKNLKTGEYSTEFYDFVFVCNGHYTYPVYPEIENMKEFKGRQMHSHLYRKASDFKDETVLIIGCGPSGIDIAHQLNSQAKKVFLSHHLDPAPDTVNIVHKPDVLKFEEEGAIFKDGSKENFSVVVYCTGYSYWFPFISADCEIHLKENTVQQLYKHLLNINHPTMALVGLPSKVVPTLIFDLQIRFALKFFLKEKNLPSEEEMLADLESKLEAHKARGLPLCRFHVMGEKQFDYFQELAELAEIEPIKPVICNIVKDCKVKFIYESETYRDNIFKIVDDENFLKYKRQK